VVEDGIVLVEEVDVIEVVVVVDDVVVVFTVP
jgi:hypothetical protein